MIHKDTMFLSNGIFQHIFDESQTKYFHHQNLLTILRVGGDLLPDTLDVHRNRILIVF